MAGGEHDLAKADNLREESGWYLQAVRLLRACHVGEGSVNHNIAKAETVAGVRAIHQANDVGRHGWLYVREGDCLQCKGCLSDDDRACPNKKMCGKLQLKEVPSAAVVKRNVITHNMLGGYQQQVL